MVMGELVSGARATLAEFSENTSIHGIKYIAEQGRRWVERFLWLLTEALCLLGAVYMVMHLLSMFYKYPVRTRVESYFYETWLIPFPAITLCNVNRIFLTKATRFANKLSVPPGLPVSKKGIVQLLPLLGQLLAPDGAINLPAAKHLHDILTHNNISSIQALDELGQTCEELLEACSWEGRTVPCSQVFTRRITFLGFCCAFNEIPEKQESDVIVDELNLSAPSFPVRTEFFGPSMGLSVLLNPMTDDYYWGSYLSSGIVCIIHGSGQVVSERSSQTLAAGGREVLVRLLPTVRSADGELRTLPAARRKCLFADENFLSMSPEYSHDNCHVECLINKTMRACKCRPPYFGDRGAGPVCGLPNIGCLKKHYFEFIGVPALRRGFTDRLAESVDQVTSECGCLAQCNSVDYDLLPTTGDFRASRYMHPRQFLSKHNVSGRTFLQVFQGSNVAPHFISDAVSNPTQLMSSLGGIFSLFLGCSFMSVVELTYFFTVRLCLLVRGLKPTTPLLAPSK